jgi:hypothetical protein
MEIKLQSFFTEVEDSKQLNIFSKKKENNLENDYKNILEKVSNEKYFHNNKNWISEKEFNCIKDNKLVGSFYYGEHGIVNRRKYNIKDEAKENLNLNDAIQDKFLYYIRKFRIKNKSYLIIFIEYKDNKNPISIMKKYFKDKFNLTLQKFIEKDVYNYILNHSITALEYITQEEEIINNPFAILEENDKKMDIKKRKVILKLSSDLTENQKEKIQGDYFRNTLQEKSYFNLKFDKRKVKISKSVVNMNDYFFLENIDGELYDENGQLYIEKIENILDKEYEYVKKIIIGEQNDKSI